MAKTEQHDENRQWKLYEYDDKPATKEERKLAEETLICVARLHLIGIAYETAKLPMPDPYEFEGMQLMEQRGILDSYMSYLRGKTYESTKKRRERQQRNRRDNEGPSIGFIIF